MDLSFVRDLDPALVHADPQTTSTVVAVHAVHRARPLFEHPKDESLPFADVVETLLDLYDLRLTQQADELIARMRERK